MQNILIYLDTDKHVSPFDLLMFTDAFPDLRIFYYSQVEPGDAAGIVRDAMFARGPEGAAHTKLFIGGRDLDKAGKILEVVKSTMFPPFEMAVIVDPKGANTTGSALVAKVVETLGEKGLGQLSGKKVTVLAGTGPVGQVSAKLMALEGAEVTLTSRSGEKARSISEKLNKEVRLKRIKGAQASNEDEVAAVVEDAEVIVGTGAAGVQLLSLKTLRESAGKCRVLADLNASPPYGIEGLEPSYDKKEVLPGVFGVGALVIGKLKNKVETSLMEKALTSAKGVFDYEGAYRIAKSLVRS